MSCWPQAAGTQVLCVPWYRACSIGKPLQFLGPPELLLLMLLPWLWSLLLLSPLLLLSQPRLLLLLPAPLPRSSKQQIMPPLCGPSTAPSMTPHRAQTFLVLNVIAKMDCISAERLCAQVQPLDNHWASACTIPPPCIEHHPVDHQ